MESYSSTCATPGVFGQTFASAIQFFAAAQCVVTEGVIPNYDVTNGTEFDIIIVGAGTAGSVLAYRLSEIKDWNVLLVEAGDDPPPEADVPYLDSAMYETKYDWSYLTVDDGVTRQGLLNGSSYWSRGKMMGGCSNLNAMVYIRGNDYDFQSWFDAGNPEWSVEEVRRCFRKAENQQDMEKLKNPDIFKYYGHDGPLVINKFNSTYSHINDKVLSAWDEIGVKNVPDLNMANVIGSGLKTATAANGERQSTNKAYVNKAIGRQNLKIIKNSLVTKVLIDNVSKIAYGIEVERNSEKYVYYATKEVIISSGAINSPQILMLSGVGPKEHLISKNIPVIIDSPMVGQNLQDHSMIFIPIFGNEPGELKEADIKLDAIKYLHSRTGYLAHNGLSEVISFFSLDKNLTYPQYQTHILIIFKNNSGFGSLLKNHHYI